MKIISLIGSLRESSYNRKIFLAYKELAAGQATIDEGSYAQFPIYNFDLHQEGFPEAVVQLGNQICAADGILFFSPEYNYSVPGPLKNAIDWLSRLTPQPFAGKPAAIIGASPGKIGTANWHLFKPPLYEHPRGNDRQYSKPCR